jgi:class 3 adenylate cyclase
MSKLDAINQVTECNLLVAFTDMTGFAKTARQISPRELWEMMSDHYELVGDVADQAEGKVVKFIGDASLIVFPEEKANEGVLALKKLKEVTDGWFGERALPCRLRVSAHFGPVMCGPIGARADKRFDVSGVTVMTAARLKTHSFALTPQAFRRLTPEARKLFKKHTPPIRYIPLESRREDEPD